MNSFQSDSQRSTSPRESEGKLISLNNDPLYEVPDHGKVSSFLKTVDEGLDLQGIEYLAKVGVDLSTLTQEDKECALIRVEDNYYPHEWKAYFEIVMRPETDGWSEAKRVLKQINYKRRAYILLEASAKAATIGFK